MLIILFGTTVEMGKKSREYFTNHGFEIIQKYNYIPDDFALPARFEKRKKSPENVVMNCDFVYENNGMLVGFNKQQIIDAVRGRKKCLISISSNTIEFIKQIKAAYGEYVTVIGTYIDDRTLNNMFKTLAGITEEELIRRVDIGRQVKKLMLQDRELFDYFVMYGGEDSPFNYESLAVQYDYMLKQVEQREKELNDKMYVEMPYSGRENYIFISYSHSDTIKVFPVLHQLQFNGYRIWYDEGINGGENWRKIIASKIQDDKCKQILLFTSVNSIESRHVKAEINLALNLDKKITTICLDNAKFSTDIEMYLSSDQYLSIEDVTILGPKTINAIDNSTNINTNNRI